MTNETLPGEKESTLPQKKRASMKEQTNIKSIRLNIRRPQAESLNRVQTLQRGARRQSRKDRGRSPIFEIPASGPRLPVLLNTNDLLRFDPARYAPSFYLTVQVLSKNPGHNKGMNNEYI